MIFLHQIVYEIHKGFGRIGALIYCWVPGHVGVVVNKLASVAAKALLRQDPADPLLPWFNLTVTGLCKARKSGDVEQTSQFLRSTDDL